jgi:hypothetical protein
VLYSKDRNFLFIKSSKTAGTSIEIALSRHLCHPLDLITPFGTRDEFLRMAFGASSPRNCFKPIRPDRRSATNIFHGAKIFFSCLMQQTATADQIQDLLELRHRRNNLAIQNHASLDVVIDMIGTDNFMRCFSCGFVRDPKSRAISQFFWRNRQQDFTGYSKIEIQHAFTEFLANRYRSLRSQLTGIKHADCGVSRIYKFEDLHGSYLSICDFLAIPDDERLTSLPQAKAKRLNTSGSCIPSDELLTPEAVAIIAEKCSWEYENFYPRE